jgi:hypothetical protein
MALSADLICVAERTGAFGVVVVIGAGVLGVAGVVGVLGVVGLAGVLGVVGHVVAIGAAAGSELPIGNTDTPL